VPSKPRTSRIAFQGLGLQGLKILARAREETGLAVVTEAVDEESDAMVEDHAGCGADRARNMQNFLSLGAGGEVPPADLPQARDVGDARGVLMAAEYIVSEGNYRLLCERGVRTFADHTRKHARSRDRAALKHLSHCDPGRSEPRAPGRRDKVAPLGHRAAVVVGADGVMVEVHHEPDKALSDGRRRSFPISSGSVRDLRALAANHPADSG